MDLCKFEIFVVSQIYEWMDGCKFEIVFMVSQMHGWMDGCISVSLR